MTVRLLHLTSVRLWITLVIIASRQFWVMCTVSESIFLQLTCHDDFSRPLVQSLASDCSQYALCHSGMAITLSCPQGYIFSDFTLRCQLPLPQEKLSCTNKLLGNMPMTCMWSPMARQFSYLSCAQYFDCGARPARPGAQVNYITECPYPQLFSTITGRCEAFQNVQCIGRTVPKAPCDYLQYRQLCEGPSCIPCGERHPSCVGRPNGKYLVPRSTRVFFECQSERTINIGRCTPGFIFSMVSQSCQRRNNSSLVPPLALKSATDASELLNKLLRLGNSTIRNQASSVVTPVADSTQYTGSNTMTNPYGSIANNTAVIGAGLDGGRSLGFGGNVANGRVDQAVVSNNRFLLTGTAAMALSIPNETPDSSKGSSNGKGENLGLNGRSLNPYTLLF